MTQAYVIYKKTPLHIWRQRVYKQKHVKLNCNANTNFLGKKSKIGYINTTQRWLQNKAHYRDKEKNLHWKRNQYIKGCKNSKCAGK